MGCKTRMVIVNISSEFSEETMTIFRIVGEVTEVVNIKVAYIRPQYHDLEEWMSDPNNEYIGRSGVVFIHKPEGKYRWPKRASIWANPFKIGKDDRRSILEQYERYIVEKIHQHPEIYNLESLRGKKLGCWCHPEPCHGDILVKLLK